MLKKFIKLMFRAVCIFILIFPLFYPDEFIRHFYFYLTGKAFTIALTHGWGIVVVNIIFFSSFLIPLSFRRKPDWREYGTVSAFFVSLFVEMYGVPFTLLFLARIFEPYTGSVSAEEADPQYVMQFDSLELGMDFAMTYGAFLIISGMILIIVGWITLYTNKNKRFVKTGIYTLSRHPQYWGFILVVVGWLIGWTSLVTVVFAPVLVWRYTMLCFKEEERFISKEYEAYAVQTPLFF